MTKYIPTTEQVRDAYVRAMRNAFIASSSEHYEEFDRWLHQHDIEFAEKLGWKPFGSHADERPELRLEFTENTDNGFPDWERPIEPQEGQNGR